MLSGESTVSKSNNEGALIQYFRNIPSSSGLYKLLWDLCTTLLVILWGCTPSDCLSLQTAQLKKHPSFPMVSSYSIQRENLLRPFCCCSAQVFKRFYILILWEFLMCTVKKHFKLCEMQHFPDLGKYGIIFQTSTVRRN